jgi:formamidopyrimidine-DNA glycosylase
MLMHFGMTGSLAYFKSPEEEEPSHSRLLFAFQNEDSLASNALSPSRDLTRLVIYSSLVEWAGRVAVAPLSKLLRVSSRSVRACTNGAVVATDSASANAD